MQRRSFHELFHGLGAVAFLLVLAAIPLGLIWHLAAAEHDRRVAVLNRGISASAVVTESAPSFLGRSCRFQYRFSIDGITYEGGEGGCPLVDSQPVGSSLQVRLNPKDPQNSVALGADLWPGWVVVLPLVGLPLLLLASLAVYAVFENSFRERRSRR
ncbi:DUF3592 domain-containing protein [Sphingopyxis sp.]|uniref:DUF3592 domain-containing protein n=1 Tax=Sphingopyxis sp. TaxID=1908224 RepID=UPI003D80E8EC